MSFVQFEKHIFANLLLTNFHSYSWYEIDILNQSISKFLLSHLSLKIWFKCSTKEQVHNNPRFLFKAMIFSLVIFLFLFPFFSGGPAHGNENVEDTLQDIASVMRSSLKEENCVCKSPLVSPLSALSRLTFKDFDLGKG